MAATIAQDSVWLMKLMEDLPQLVDYPVVLHCDNQEAIRLAENVLFHARTKHIEVHRHLIREKVIQEEMEMKKHIKTKEQVSL